LHNREHDAPLNAITNLSLGAQAVDPGVIGLRQERPVSNAPPSRLSASDLNNLMRALDIDVVALTEILAPRGHRLARRSPGLPRTE